MMNRKQTIVGMVAAALLMAAPVMAQKPTVPNSSYTGKGNPILPDFHADPEILYSNKTKKYYIYSTTDGTPRWGGWQYYCYSSKNLKKWKNEGVVLDAKSDQISWANGNLWAPAAVEVKQKSGTDEWYIVYHRINKDYIHFQPGVHREVCIDKMEFNADGTIKRVVPTHKGI